MLNGGQGRWCVLFEVGIAVLLWQEIIVRNERILVNDSNNYIVFVGNNRI